jgi:phosphatidate cytidylyltransferase
MTQTTRDRLFVFQHAFDHPVTVAITAFVALVLLIVPAVIWILAYGGRVKDAQQKELWTRYTSWLVLIPLMLGPVLLGAAWTIAAVLVLSLACYREFARITGLFRAKAVSLVVVVGIFAVTFAVADNWYGFFVALFPLTVGTIAAVAILPDHPEGYIQRVALGVFAFVLFGGSLGHLGYMANDTNYRPLILLILLAVEANDVFAYVVGKTFGHRKLAPYTSPNKTVAGAAGAIVLTTLLVMPLGHYVFEGTKLDRPTALAALGLIISIVGQFGDLMLSSIKRDLGIKDTGITIPGHGGLLDRFDSLILVAPAVFHFVHYLVGLGAGQPARIFTGG